MADYVRCHGGEGTYKIKDAKKLKQDIKDRNISLDEYLAEWEIDEENNTFTLGRWNEYLIEWNDFAWFMKDQLASGEIIEFEFEESELTGNVRIVPNYYDEDNGFYGGEGMVEVYV